MPSNRAPASTVPAEAAVVQEKDCACHDKSTPQEPKPPRAGRTGGLGARAERPSDGKGRKVEDKDKATPGRGAKAPSARESTASEERSGK